MGGGGGGGGRGVRGRGVEKTELAQGLDMKLAAKRLKQDQVGGWGVWEGGGWSGGGGEGYVPHQAPEGTSFHWATPRGSGAAVCRWYALPDSRLIWT